MAYSSEAANQFRQGATAPFNEVERTRHENFVRLRLALALPVMALAPVFLLLRGAPGFWEALAFALWLAPLTGVYALRRHGRFDVAQAIWAGSMILFGVTLTAARGELGIAAATCFLLAPLEAGLGASSALAIGVGAFSLAGVVAMIAATKLGLPHPVESAGDADGPVVAAAATYAALLAVWGARADEMRDCLVGRGLAAFHELTDIVGDLVLRFDAGGRVVDVAADPGEALHCASGDLMGRGFFERVLVSDRPNFLKAISDAAHKDEAVRIELRLRAGPEGQGGETAPPRFVWMEMRARWSSGQGSVMAALRELTALKEAREALDAAREAGERIGLSRDRFLANVSHELRTPLNAIIGFSEILGNPAIAPADPARQREYANIVNASGQHLLSLVNTILDISKIESGNFEIAPEPFRPRWLIDFCCDVVQLKAESKQIALSRACPAQLEDMIADKRACKQILLNLISNALKFTPEGGAITVAARVDGGLVEIAVSDTGIGVTPKDLSRLGDPFFQAQGTDEKSAYDRAYEGAGLGLSIVRGLVGLHGGSILFESAPNEGARVVVRLPVDCRAVQAAAKPAKIETLSQRSRAALLELVRPDGQAKKIA